jgi:hypothetical protein
MAERAGLDQLKKMVGSRTEGDDALLGICLEAAGMWVYDRVYPTSIGRPEVIEAVLLLAARLYKRRQSPEGVAGWDEMGAVRIIARDHDIERLLEQHIQVYKVLGIG